MIPPQVAIEIFRGNAAMATQEGFEALVPAIDGLDVDQASDMFAFGAIDRLMVDTEDSGAHWVAGTTIGHEHRIRGDDWFEGRDERVGGDRGQHGAARGTRAIGGDQHRDLLVAEPAFGGGRATLAWFAVKLTGAFPAVTDKGLVGFHNAAELPRGTPRRGQEPVSPAKCRAHGDTAPFGRAGYRRVFGKTAGKLPPPVAQPQTGQGRARQRVEGLAARFAGIATQTIGAAPRHRPGDAAAWTAAVFTDPRFQHPDDRGQTLLVAKQALNLRALRLRKIVEPRKPNQKFFAIHRNPLIPFIKTLRNYIRIVNAN